MKPKVTTDQIEDLIEYALGVAKPDIKTKRSVENLEITVNRRKFVVRVERKKKAA
jgi:hypothetical protein